MSTLGATQKIYVKATSSAPSGGDEVNGAIDFTMKRSKTVHDTTDTKDAGVETNMLGVSKADGSLSGDWEESDAPQTLLRTCHDSGAIVYVTRLHDGTNGFTYPCLVTDIDEKGGVSGKNEVTFSLKRSGASIARP